MCSFKGLVLLNDPDASVGLLCPSSQQSVKVCIIFLTVASNDLFLQALDENGVPSVLCLHYCPKFLADHVVWAFSLEYPIMMCQTPKNCIIFLTTYF